MCIRDRYNASYWLPDMDAIEYMIESDFYRDTPSHSPVSSGSIEEDEPSSTPRSSTAAKKTSKPSSTNKQEPSSTVRKTQKPTAVSPTKAPTKAPTQAPARTEEMCIRDSSFTGGAALKWYRDNFAKYEKAIAEKNGGSVYSMLDSMTKDEPTGILIMPHFTGAANPYMDSGSRAAIAGLSLEHTNYDIYKALMEGVTYEILINIEHLEGFGIKPKQFFATGGGASSKKWLEIKADILNLSLIHIFRIVMCSLSFKSYM